MPRKPKTKTTIDSRGINFFRLGYNQKGKYGLVRTRKIYNGRIYNFRRSLKLGRYEE